MLGAAMCSEVEGWRQRVVLHRKPARYGGAVGIELGMKHVRLVFTLG